MKTIMVHINADEGQEARLAAALALVRAFEGHLLCVQIINVSRYVIAEPYVGMTALGPVYDVLQQENEADRTRIEARLKTESVSWDWRYIDGTDADTLVRESRLADMVVMSLDQPQHHGKVVVHPLPLVADVAIHARTPVLALPEVCAPFDPKGVAMVAWNGSAEGAHAMRFAVPLLRKAAAVHVVATDEEGTLYPATMAVTYLAREGIAATLSTCGQYGADPKVALPRAVLAVEASYMVMGAYGHTRFREAVLGGVTRHMLRHSTVPLLLAH